MLVDPQYSTARILKPFTGFETKYQGKSSAVPIAFPGTIDRQAADGVPGFDPHLLAGLPVPLGSRIMIWIPLALVNVDETDEDLDPTAYTYQIVWRLRSSTDYIYTSTQNVPVDEQLVGHLRKRDQGAPNDPADPTATQRIFLPSALKTIAYEQAEPSADPEVNANGSINLRGELVTPCGGSSDSSLWQGPLLPTADSPPNVGLTGQGVLPQLQDPSSTLNEGVPGGPIYHPYWFDAEGDEMMIFARRATPAAFAVPWDFTDNTLDLGFSNIYGTNNGARPPIPSVGIYVFTGTP